MQSGSSSGCGRGNGGSAASASAKRIGRVGFARICVVGGGGVRGAGLFLDERSGYLGGFRARCETSGVVG